MNCPSPIACETSIVRRLPFVNWRRSLVSLLSCIDIYNQILKLSCDEANLKKPQEQPTLSTSASMQLPSGVLSVQDDSKV